jgi:uncharacterized membrane protein YphA (DoxX/SURF4 family)
MGKKRPEHDDGGQSMSWLPVIISSWLAYLLLVSGLRHLDNSYFFLHTIYSYRIAEPEQGRFLALILPVLEISLGLVLLLPGRNRCTYLLLAMVLFSGYTILQFITMKRGLNIACGCFGNPNENPIGYRSIGFATSCAVLAAIGSFIQKRNTSRNPDA